MPNFFFLNCKKKSLTRENIIKISQIISEKKKKTQKINDLLSMHLIQNTQILLVLPHNLSLYSKVFKLLWAKSNHKSIKLHLIFVNLDSIK